MVTISKDGNEWNVKSADGQQEYSVVCEHDACQQKCQIVCNYCMYSHVHMYMHGFSHISYNMQAYPPDLF